MSTLTGPEVVPAQPCGDAVERDLIRRCRVGDTVAFDELVVRNHAHVARAACRLLGSSHDVDDVVQDVFLRVLERLDTFRAESKFSTWLLSITVNRCRSQLRRRALRRRALAIIGRRSRSQSEHTSTDGDGAAVSVREAVARLPATFREPIVLRYFEELSMTEIADVLGITPTAVEARLSRGRRRLKSHLPTTRDHDHA